MEIFQVPKASIYRVFWLRSPEAKVDALEIHGKSCRDFLLNTNILCILYGLSVAEGKAFTSCCLLFLAAGLCTKHLGRGVSRGSLCWSCSGLTVLMGRASQCPRAPSSLFCPSAGYYGLCQGCGVTQQGRKGTFMLRAFCETGRCCQQFNKLCLSSNTPLNLDLF